MQTLYHFTTKDFLRDLELNRSIEARKTKISGPKVLAYYYLFERVGYQFFTWKSTELFKDEIKAVDNSDFVMLELCVPDEECIDMSYDNWDDFIRSLHLKLFEYQEDIDLSYEFDYDFLLDKYLKREVPEGHIYSDYDIKAGFKKCFNIYDDIDTDIQTLIPYIKYEWVKGVTPVEERIISL